MICEFYHNKAIKKPLKPYNTPLLTVQTDPHDVHVSPTIRPQVPPPAATSTPLPTHSAPGPPASLDPLHGPGSGLTSWARDAVPHLLGALPHLLQVFVQLSSE